MGTLAEHLPEGRSLLVSAHADNKVLSYTAGEWTTAALEAPRGIAAPQPTAADPVTYVAVRRGVAVFRGPAHVVTVHTDDLMTHEIVAYGTQLYIAAGLTSSVVSVDLDDLTARPQLRWTLPGVDTTPDNRSHISGLSLSPDKVVVTVLGMSNEPGGWRAEAAAGRGELVDLVTGATVVKDQVLPHSPRIDAAGRIWWLNSGKGELCVLDPKSPADTHDYSVVGHFPGFARGLAILDDVVIVGISTGRHSAKAPVTVDPYAEPGLVVLDRHTGQVLGFEPLDVDEIFDVQLGTAALA